MARIISTTDLGNGLTKTVENRTRRVCINVETDGTVALTFEREAVTRINGEMVGGPMPVAPVTIGDAAARAVPLFATCFGALANAGDATEQAVADAVAQAAAAEAAQENG